MTAIDHHHTTVKQGLVKPGDKSDNARFEPVCSCGWTGRVTNSKRAALDDADEHVLAMARVED